jgi:hypothetical protein
MKNCITLCIILFSGWFLYSCSDSTNLDNNYNESLIGKWKWVKTTGGIDANYLLNPEIGGYNLYHTFIDSTVIVDRIETNYRFIDTLNYTYKKDFSLIKNDSSMVLFVTCKNKEEPFYGIKQLTVFTKDTLILADDCVDGQAHYYVRIK